MSRLDCRTVSRAVIAGVVVAALGLGACGRKGPLEAPPDAALGPADAAGDDAGMTKPDQPFILDPLL